MIILSDKNYKKLFEYARSQIPFEACGLLAGKVENNSIIIKDIYCLSNADKSETHFSIEISEQLSAVKKIRADGFTLLGNWHSHTNTSALPSREDIRLAYDNNAIYIILSLHDNDLKAFRIIDGSYYEEKLTILQNFD